MPGIVCLCRVGPWAWSLYPDKSSILCARARRIKRRAIRSAVGILLSNSSASLFSGFGHVLCNQLSYRVSPAKKARSLEYDNGICIQGRDGRRSFGGIWSLGSRSSRRNKICVQCNASVLRLHSDSVLSLHAQYQCDIERAQRRFVQKHWKILLGNLSPTPSCVSQQ